MVGNHEELKVCGGTLSLSMGSGGKSSDEIVCGGMSRMVGSTAGHQRKIKHKTRRRLWVGAAVEA